MRINTLFIISIVLFLVAIISIIVINQIENDKMSDTFKYLREELTKDINTYNFDENIYNKNLSNIPLYFINLPKSKDRKKFLDKQIKEYNIKNTKIIEAVYGKNKIPLKKENMFKIVMKTQKPIIFFNNDKSATDGEIGCTLSHLNTILHAYNNNLEFVIICEDDVDLYWIKTWDKTINDIIRQAPHDWEYINLKKFASRSKQKYRKYVLGQTTACQLLNRKGMKKILSKCYKNNEFILNRNFITRYESTLINILYTICPTTLFFVNLPATIPADFYIPGLLKSYVYEKTLVPTQNDNNEMDSTIHSDHTYLHIYQNIKDIKRLYKDFKKNTK